MGYHRGALCGWHVEEDKVANTRVVHLRDLFPVTAQEDIQEPKF